MGGKLDKAQSNGALREFNDRYRSARLLAEKESRRFPGYAAAKARLEAQLAHAAASGRPIDFAKLFEETT
ncbi:unnamed protein product [uncultured bacterium]|nr:unnamed protein product [uncultured bacterium]